MNTDHHDPRDPLFDAALRARHQAALEHLSPRVLAQLAQRRNGALRGAGARRWHGFRYAAAGFAGLCALALGLQFRSLPGPGAPAATPVGTATAAAANAAPTMLDEDPEFYAWLASSDAQLVAME
jgi:hypothetical protein